MSVQQSGPTVLGLNPWLPWPFSQWRWWTEPVRAERLAALRIGLAAVMLLDLLFTYIPDLHLFYGADSLSHAGGSDLFDFRFKPPRWGWSLFHGLLSPFWFRFWIVTWVIAGVFMLIGFCTRASVLIVWACSVSFSNINTLNDNAGDQVRTIALFYLMLSRCGAVWSVDGWLARKLGRSPGPVYVYPWVLRLLLIQMVFIYFVNGLSKIVGSDWREGNTLYYVLNDLTLARWSYASFPIPLLLTRLMTWSVLVWEFTFPIWMVLPWLVSGICVGLRLRSRFAFKVIRFLRQVRAVMLVFGVLFHVGILVMMELGYFGMYMICLYLPLVPWERWLARRRLARARVAATR
jgi:hypothetical protein